MSITAIHAFLAGYMPMQKRAQITTEEREELAEGGTLQALLDQQARDTAGQHKTPEDIKLQVRDLASYLQRSGLGSGPAFTEAGTAVAHAHRNAPGQVSPLKFKLSRWDPQAFTSPYKEYPRKARENAGQPKTPEELKLLVRDYASALQKRFKTPAGQAFDTASFDIGQAHRKAPGQVSPIRYKHHTWRPNSDTK